MLLSQAKENVKNEVKNIVQTRNAFYDALNEKVRSKEVAARQ